MASLCCNNNQVRDSRVSKTCHGTRSCSKAQASLSKILHLISTIPPTPEKRGFDIDLNLRLGSFLDDDEEEEEEKSESLAENSFVGKNPDGQEEEKETEEIQQKTATDASSDVTEMQKSDELKNDTEGEVKTTALDLLIEAAELISEKDKEDEIENDDDNDDVSPVVRSKRGRCQILPRRFRDSVLDPWKKSTAVVVSSKKRRSR